VQAKKRYRSQNPPSGDTADGRIESFMETLRKGGYVPQSIRIKQSIVRAFMLWTRRAGVSVDECEEGHVVAFLRRRAIRSRDRVVDERATVRLFLRQVRGQDGVHHAPLRFDTAPAEDIERQYLEHLRHERGLANNSILVYMPYVRDFLSAVRSRRGSLATCEIDASHIQAFMLGRLRGRSSEWSRLLSVALRSFLRFLYVRGKTSIDLSRSVPTVQRWRQASVPQYLAPQQVALVLSATPRSTLNGRRDYAILLLMARLGLRAGEIVLMELGDIRWKSGEIVIRGKGGMRDRLPLLTDIGQSLVAYLRKGRPRVASRRVFLRLIPPWVGLTGPAAVAHIARAALARAGIHRTSRGAAHVFRHSLATGMLCCGASLPEISEVLRHRSPDTTAIYAKVDFEALRSVAKPWLRAGGAR
jgi:integrase/recombinase XerD